MMIIFGYAKGSRVNDRGVTEIQVRIPSIHGPWDMKAYNGARVRNYTLDQDLPYYPSLILPRDPEVGDVVALISFDETPHNLMVIGLTGTKYSPEE